MMSDEKNLTPEMDAALDRLLKEARDHEPGPSDAFLNRVLEDAAAMVPPAPVAVPPVAEVPARRGFLEAVLAGLGGWQGAVAVAASALIGIGLGYSSPDLAANLPFLAGAEAEVVPDDADLGFDTFDITSLDL